MPSHFLLEYWLDDNWYVGRLKGIPGVFSQGRTLAELEENIREVYDLMLQEEEQAPAGSQTKELSLDA